jgi:hypothetical protein
MELLESISGLLDPRLWEGYFNFEWIKRQVMLGYLDSKRFYAILDCDPTQLHQVIWLAKVDLCNFSVDRVILDWEGPKVAFLGLHIEDILHVCLEQAHFFLLLLECWGCDGIVDVRLVVLAVVEVTWMCSLAPE